MYVDNKREPATPAEQSLWGKDRSYVYKLESGEGVTDDQEIQGPRVMMAGRIQVYLATAHRSIRQGSQVMAPSAAGGRRGGSR